MFGGATISQLIELSEQRLSIRAIARRSEISRDAVRKYLRVSGVADEGRHHSASWTVLPRAVSTRERLFTLVAAAGVTLTLLLEHIVVRPLPSAVECSGRVENGFIVAVRRRVDR